MNYRVLLAVPSDEIENSLVARFQELSDWDVVSVQRSSRELTDMVIELADADVVVIHHELGPLPVLDLIRDLSRNQPQLAIILLVDETTPELFSNAMEAGVRGVLASDAPLDELNTRLSAAAEWSRTLRRHLEAASRDTPASGPRGSIVTVSGAKGGVGTTTVALHTALAAAQSGRTVCLVDLDLPSGDLPSYLDQSHRRGIIDLAEAGDDISAAMLADTLYVHPTGLHVLLAPAHGERSEDVTARSTRQILGALRSRYELVIVDCSATMTEATAIAVELADSTVVALTPDLAALRGAQRLLSMWERLQIRQKRDCHAVLVRHNRRSEIQPDFTRKLLNCQVLETAIPARYWALEEATNTGDPSRVSDDQLRRAYGQVASELGLVRTTAAAPQPAAAPNGDQRRSGGLTGLFGGARGRRDRGGVLVEFTAAVPMLLLALVVVLQVMILGLAWLYTSHGASEGARQAAVTPGNTERIEEEVGKRIHGSFGEDVEVTVLDSGEAAGVRVTVDVPVLIPGVDDTWTVGNEGYIAPSGAPE
ncbi:AAA family ATPase [Lipingzhangella sp. LS1_29]|uniref:AAA family ATPase n=1 Tax=Lipingzhangella rawalii TaxID=2055835 RepID=A0ABU2H6M5_9ACTN|nr:AAA family ATPase [Lipingzhangella rawalii]MDS1270957.1 AAA family ATPase [Lipingzhangella rawalii]